MNAKAAALGMKNTHFANPHGIHDDNHYTTAYDIYLMCAAAMEYEVFRTIVSTAVYTLPATNLSAERIFYNTNGLLSNWYVIGYIYPDAIGIKTGYTEEAGRCIATAATDDQGRTFYCIILGAENAYNEEGKFVWYAYHESKRLLQWAFSNFRRITLLDKDTEHVIREVPVTMSDEADYVLTQPVGSIVATMPTDYDPDLAELIVKLPESVEAPVAAGDELGTITILYEGVNYGTLKMVATDPVTRSEFQHNVQLIKTYWAKWWVKAALVLFLVLVFVLILWLAVIRPRRKARRRYSYSGASRRGSSSRATRSNRSSSNSYRGRRR
jgi:D-alanyl-D-alanine carboxypeptidase (penicillin-binding protein 5/6)